MLGPTQQGADPGERERDEMHLAETQVQVHQLVLQKAEELKHICHQQLQNWVRNPEADWEA